MSNDDSPGADEGDDDEEVVRERAGRLDEKEQRLASQERELEQRAEELDELEDELLERRETIVAEREELETKEAELEEREETIEDRETAIAERERDLDQRAEEIDQREETLREYVGEQLADYEQQVADTVEESVTAAIEAQDLGGGDRSGSMGNLLLALVGLVLVVGGVSNLFATETNVIPALFASAPANYGTVAVLIFSGMAANLAAAAGRM